jgi:hypothetical protein
MKQKRRRKNRRSFCFSAFQHRDVLDVARLREDVEVAACF